MMRPSYRSGYARHGGEAMHPSLWQGIDHAWIPGLGNTGLTLRDVVGSSHGTVGASVDWTTDTTEHDGLGKATDAISVGLQDYAGKSGTIMSIARSNITIDNDYKWLISRNDAGDNAGDCSLFYDEPSNKMAWLIQTGSGTTKIQSGVTGIPAKKTVYCGTWSPRQLEYFEDGESQGTGTARELFAHPAWGFAIAQESTEYQSNNFLWDGGIYFTAFWNRVLSLPEIRLFNHDHMALVRLRPRVFATAGAAPPAGGDGAAMYHHLQNLGVY